MNCDQRRDQMMLLLVDGLEPADAAALRAHLATGCARCSASLAEADATLAYLPYALTAQSLGSGVRGRVLERIATMPGETPRVSQRWRMPRWVSVALPAAIAACVAILVTGHFMLEAMNKQRQDLLAKLTTRDSRIDALTSEAQAAAQTIEVMYASSKLISLAGQDQPGAFARAMWDEHRKAWHFRAFNLAPLASKSEAYELWFVTPYGRKVPTRPFTPDEHGNATFVVSLPKDVGPIAGAFVTDEPSVGTFQPTGTTHLYGRLE